MIHSKDDISITKQWRKHTGINRTTQPIIYKKQTNLIIFQNISENTAAHNKPHLVEILAQNYGQQI